VLVGVNWDRSAFAQVVDDASTVSIFTIAKGAPPRQLAATLPDYLQLWRRMIEQASLTPGATLWTVDESSPDVQQLIHELGYY